MSLFKEKTKKRMVKALTAFMATATLVGAVGAGSMTAFAADNEPTPFAPKNGEKIWSVDPFDAEYSSGYFCIKDSVGHNCKSDGEHYYDSPDDCVGTNTSRQADIYIDHHNGACMNGTYLDIREYVWTADNDYWSIMQSGANGVHGTADASITREFHFYESGTLDSANPVETTFKGVMRLTDMDIEEGYSFRQGLKGAWLNSLTHVTKRDDVTWKGTWENGNDGVNVEREFLWVEVEGTPQKPLIFTYWGNGGHASAVNYYGSNINYKLVENSKNKLPDGAQPAVGTHCATYASYNLMPADEFIRYQFNGWYNDQKLTNKSAETVMVSSDMTFYGTYITVAGLIETEVKNGTITPTDECFDYGGDKVIEYAPAEGYLLDTVTVDGQKVDITKHPSSYTFANVQDDHKVSVVYVKASMDKEVSMKESTDKYEPSQVIDNKVIKNGDVVTYTVSFENPTGAARNVQIIDAIPAGAEVVDGSISDSGSIQDGNVVWNLNVAAYTSGSVSFDAKIADAAKGSIVKNTANVIFKALDPNSSEKDVVIKDTVSSPILDDPEKSVMNADGKDITNKIVADGQTLTYVVSFANPAEETKTFTVADQIPDGVTLVDGGISDGGAAKDGVVTWKVDVAAGQSKSVSFKVKVDKPANELTKIYNQAKVSVDSTSKDSVSPVGPEGEPKTPVYVLDDPMKMTVNAKGDVISHDKDGNVIQTVKQAGDTIEYQVSFQNPATDAREFTITDKLPEGVAFVSADHDGSYDADTHTVSWKVSVEADKKETVAVKVEILKAAEDRILKNKAVVSVDEAVKDTNIVETPVIPVPEKDVVSKPGEASMNTMPVQVGENMYYTVTYKNPSDYDKTAVIKDQLPEGVKFVSADNDGVYDKDSHTVTWTVETKAHTEMTVTVKVKVLASASGSDLNNQAEVLMDEADIRTITHNGDDEDETTSNFVPGKFVMNAEGTDINKTVVAVDDVVTYKITYKNAGNNVRKVNIIDVLPQDVTYVEASDGGAVKSIVHGQTVMWEFEADPRSEGFVTVSVKVTSVLKNQAFANSATLTMTDEITEQSKSVHTNQVTNYVMDDVVKAAYSENGKKDEHHEVIKAGEKIRYTITVKNPAPEEREFVITDEVPEGMEFVSAENDGVYDKESNIITWTVKLESSKSATVAFTAKVDKSSEGTTVQNIATVMVDQTVTKSNRVKTLVEKPDTLLDDLKELIGDKDDENKKPETEKQPADNTQKPSGAQTPSGNTGNTGSTGNTGNTGSNNGGNTGVTGKPDGTTITSNDGPKTGDDSNIGLWTVIAGIALAGGIGFAVYAATRKKEDEE